MPQTMIPRSMSAAVLILIVFSTLTGCGKRVATSAGDASSAAKEKGTAAPVETIQPERMATIPDEKSTTLETARAPIDVVPAPSGGGAPSAPPSGVMETTTAPAAAADIATLADIFFDFDQYVIRRDAHSLLSANAAWINSRPGKSVVIEGHCDERGTQAYNLVLGDKRARSVKHYLEDLGVPAARLKTTSYGEIRPFCKERDENCYQQNRRAHFVAH